MRREGKSCSGYAFKIYNFEKFLQSTLAPTSPLGGQSRAKVDSFSTVHSANMQFVRLFVRAFLIGCMQARFSEILVQTSNVHPLLGPFLFTFASAWPVPQYLDPHGA